jgi:hypothetical protein
MKSPYILIFPFCLCYNVTMAQSLENSGISKLNLFLEIGAGYIFSTSANLEAHIASSKLKKLNWYGRAGIGGASVVMNQSGFGGLGALTMFTGKGEHHFEVSGGIFLGSDSDDGLFALPLLDLGYRFQKPGGGFIFRGKAGILGVGIGLGYAF